MHLTEGMLPLPQAVGWAAVSAPLVIWSVREEQQARQATTTSSIVMAGATSLLFAATLLPIPVPVLGASSHICLTPVLALVVGLRRIVWPSFLVLLLHAIFFAHGGITTLGINTLTLGVLGPLAAIGTWTLLRRLGVSSTLGLALACGAGDLSVYVLDAAVLAVALADVAAPMTTFTGVLLGFAPVQLPLAVLEAIVSVGIVRLIATRRADLLPRPLQALRGVPALGAATSVLLLSVLTCGCGGEGIDATIFGETARAAGRPPTDSIIDLSQGETGLSMSILILFALGFVAGRSWERLGRGERDALPR